MTVGRTWMPEKLSRLMNPRAIAIMGCSPDNAGGTALRNLLANGYEGPIFPIHPRHSEVLGLKAYPDLSSCPEKIDACVIALRAELVSAALDELHSHGVPGAVIFASGFSELGADGVRQQNEIRDKLDAYEIAACGPNCLGILSFQSKAAMYYAGLEMNPRTGPIGFVSHSGSVCIAVTNADRGTGFSYVVSCGNEAGTSVADYVEFLAADDSTEIIALHLETIRDADALARAARLAADRNKPIVVLKSGRTDAGQQTAAAHSGALATPHALSEAFFERHGMLVVESLEELLETCELLVSLRHCPPTADAVAVTAVSGGMAGLAADAGSEIGVKFSELGPETLEALSSTLSSHSTPGNPLDVTLALHDTEAYRRCLEILDADPEVGLLVVCQGAEPGLNEQQRELYAPIANMIVELSVTLKTPIISFSPVGVGLEPTFNQTLRKAGVAQLMGGRTSMQAIRHGMRWAHARRAALSSDPRATPHALPSHGSELSRPASSASIWRTLTRCARLSMNLSRRHCGMRLKPRSTGSPFRR